MRKEGRPASVLYCTCLNDHLTLVQLWHFIAAFHSFLIANFAGFIRFFDTWFYLIDLCHVLGATYALQLLGYRETGICENFKFANHATF